MRVDPWHRVASWLGRKLTHKFLLLLAGFLLLQAAQLGTGVGGLLHLGEESAALNEGGRQRMRTLLLASLARDAVDAGAWAPERRAWFREALGASDRYFAGGISDHVSDAARDAEVSRLFWQVRADWQDELRPLLASIDAAPPEASREIVSRYTALAFDKVRALDAFVERLEQHVRGDARGLAAYHAAVLAVCLALGVIGLVLARRVVTRPLRRLIEAANAIAGGAYEQRVPVASQDELGELAATFNRMVVAVGVRTARLRSFGDVAASVTSSLDLKEVLDDIMRRGTDLSGADAACIAFYDMVQGRFTHWVTQGLSAHFVRHFAIRPGGLAEEAFAGEAGVVSSDRSESRHRLSRLARNEGLRAFVCLPLVSRGRRLGVIYFYRKDRDVFLADELQVLGTFANLAAAAIANARLHEETHALAITDKLTGLRNRRLFDQALADALARARRETRSLALLMIDIDHFKRVNDTHGHAVGDQALEFLGRLVPGELRESDLAARFGGEEFAVLLPNTDAAGAKQVAERIRRRTADAALVLPGGGRLHLTVSIGVACTPAGDAPARRLLQHADQALYTAKHEGRNRVCLHEETLRARIERDPDHLVRLLNASLAHLPDVVAAISAREGRFRRHGDDVSAAAARLAEALGLPPAEREALRLAALLHDVGMLFVPETLTEKTGGLTADEAGRLESHAASGAGLLERVPRLRHVAPIVRHHHERFDGGGFPAGLRGDSIPFLARVLTVADAWGSIAAAGGEARALDALRAGAGTQFDPQIVAALAPPAERLELAA